MVEHLRRQLQSQTVGLWAAILTFLVAMFGANAASAQTQTSNDDVLPGTLANTDWFVYQCSFPEEPRFKSVYFTGIGGARMYAVIIYDNQQFSASTDIEFKDGAWRFGGEQAPGQVDLLKKDIYKIKFELMPLDQFKTLLKTQPTETCASEE